MNSSSAFKALLGPINYVILSVLQPYGRKARRHDKAQIAKLKASISEFGFSVPVLIDEDNRILAGNARVEAARQLGITEIPTVSVTHLTPTQKRAFILADNRLAELASWDKETLKYEFAELGDLELGFDLTVTGWDAPEIEAIEFGDESAETEPPLPDPPESPVTQIGDLWLLGEHRLLCADSTNRAALKQLLAADQARACFTDPPYNVTVQGNVTVNKAHTEFVMASGEMSEPEFQAFLDKTCEQAISALNPGGVAYICMDWRHIAQLQTAADRAGFETINLIVWDKKNAGMGSFYRSQHELILVVRKKGAAHLNNVNLGKNGRNRSNVWAYEGVSGFGKAKAAIRALHPTVKPIAMIRDALLDCTVKDDVVLDLFGGSGSTLIAAEMCGRKARLMELDPKYVDVITRRFEDFSGKPARLASTGQTFAEVRAERAAATDGKAA